MFLGVTYKADEGPSFWAEVVRFNTMLANVAGLLEGGRRGSLSCPGTGGRGGVGGGLR